jgi:hypothetical protein
MGSTERKYIWGGGGHNVLSPTLKVPRQHVWQRVKRWELEKVKSYILDLVRSRRRRARTLLRVIWILILTLVSCTGMKFWLKLKPRFIYIIFKYSLSLHRKHYISMTTNRLKELTKIASPYSANHMKHFNIWHGYWFEAYRGKHVCRNSGSFTRGFLTGDFETYNGPRDGSFDTQAVGSHSPHTENRWLLQKLLFLYHDKRRRSVALFGWEEWGAGRTDTEHKSERQLFI